MLLSSDWISELIENCTQIDSLIVSTLESIDLHSSGVAVETPMRLHTAGAGVMFTPTAVNNVTFPVISFLPLCTSSDAPGLGSRVHTGDTLIVHSAGSRTEHFIRSTGGWPEKLRGNSWLWESDIAA